MSWLYSQALVEEYSEENFSDGEPSAQSSGKPTQLVFSSADRTKEFSRRSLSGMTCKPLTASHGEDVLTSFLEAFPVKTSPAPEKEQASKESDHPCGRTWRESLEKFDLDTHTWKTHQCLWDEDLQPSSVILPKWGMMRSGVLWERTTLPPLTGGKGSGSWATPRSSSAMAANMSENLAARCAQYGNLEEQVSLTMWPTPAARDYKGANSLEHCEVNGTGRKHMDQLPNAVAHGDKPEPSGALSPNWVEWLMGWPIGWTNLEPIGDMDWCDWKSDPADDLPPSQIGTPRATQAIRSDEFKKARVPSPEEFVEDNPAGTGSIPRVATGIKCRADRLKAIGNGQVPQVAALAWTILNK